MGQQLEEALEHVDLKVLNVRWEAIDGVWQPAAVRVTTSSLDEFPCASVRTSTTPEVAPPLVRHSARQLCTEEGRARRVSRNMSFARGDRAQRMQLARHSR